MDTAEPFLDNWTYLRTELSWLDRVLANAIARQRKDSKEVERVSRSKADAVTSHWWKGLVTVDGLVAGDSPAELPRRRSGSNASYQQQMEARIRASRNQGIVLGLPSLCQRLDLSTFEKNTVLMALAPEINRRYARMYNFLQEVDQAGAAGLPTVDLILRLLCRNDTEWRKARLSLAAGSCLVQHGLVEFPANQAEPFLAHVVKLSDPCVEYLLAEAPTLITLENLLAAAPSARGVGLEAPSGIAFQGAGLAADTWEPERAIAPACALTSAPGRDSLVAIAPPAQRPEKPWATLVLPPPVLATVQHISDRLRYAEQVDDTWGFGAIASSAMPSEGTLVLLAGAKGTGKTTVAQAIAHSVNHPLHSLDLALVAPAQAEALCQRLMTKNLPILLLKSAGVWFGRSSPLSKAQLHQFLSIRQQTTSLTFFSVAATRAIKMQWQYQMTQQIVLSLPNQAARRQLWRLAFPAEAPLAAKIDWQTITTWRLTGKEIFAIAREAAIYAAAAQAKTITLAHITQAYAAHQTRPGLPKPMH